MRHFYANLLGLKEIYYSMHPDGTVAYDCDGLQFAIIFDAKARTASQGWAWQPGWEGGVVAYYEQPQWHNYWSFPVKDPMENTVEVLPAPEGEPENSEWQ